MWLRICELINDPLTEPEDALQEILWMNRAFSGSYTLNVLTASAAKDMCLLMGRRWPEQVLWTGGYLSDASIAEAVMSDPVPNIPFQVIDRLCGMDVLRTVDDKREFAELFSECLRALIAMERGRDTGLWGDECFTRRKVLLFDGFAYYGPVEFATARTMRLDGPGRWKDIFRGLAATIYSAVHWDREDIPWREALLLTDRQAEMVRIALEGREPERDPDAGESVEWIPTAVEDDQFPMNPTVVEDMRAVMSHPRKDSLRASIRINRNAAGRRDAPFVPSGRWCASYDDMTPAQRDFYLSWRDEVMAGSYRDTDRGYLWLLLCELIDSESEPGRRMSVLNGLLKAYGQSSDSIRGLLLRTCQDYAIITNQDPPWEEDDREAPLILWVKLDVIPVGRVPLALAAPSLDVDLDAYCTATADYETAFNIALKTLAARVMGRTGMSLAESVTGRTRTVYRKLFPGLVSDWGSCSFQVCEMRPSNSGGKMLTAAMKTAIRCINGPRGLRVPRVQSGTEPGDQEAMEAEVNAWLERRARADRAAMLRREAAAMVLDGDAVRDAQTDLAAVTELVAPEDDRVPEAAPETGSEATAEDGASTQTDPWEALAAELDDSQMGYLSASLGGNGPAFARTAGTTVVRMEDGINASAMDTVGDQIVEDGEVFDEYAEDVRRMLAPHPVEIHRCRQRREQAGVSRRYPRGR